MGDIFYHRYLNCDDLMNIFSSSTLGQKEDILISVLKSNILINNNDNIMYSWNVETKTLYRICDYSKDALNSIVGHFVELSIEALEKDGSAKGLQDQFPKEYMQLLKRSVFNKTKSIEMKMRESFTILDSDMDGIHFKNGRYNLITNQFEDRFYDPNNLITEFIPYDWTPSSVEDMNEFHISILCKLIREPEALEYIKYVIGSSLSGRNKTCDFIINHGKGSNGKSTLLEYIANTLTDCYVRKIPNDTFDSD